MWESGHLNSVVLVLVLIGQECCKICFDQSKTAEKRNHTIIFDSLPHLYNYIIVNDFASRNERDVYIGEAAIVAQYWSSPFPSGNEYEDCNAPVGVEDGRIKDHQITASSYVNNQVASRSRLHSVFSRVNGTPVWGGWCTDKLDKSQYLQVKQELSC